MTRAPREVTAALSITLEAALCSGPTRKLASQLLNHIGAIGCELKKTTSNKLNEGMTPELALAIQLVRMGVVKLPEVK